MGENAENVRTAGRPSEEELLARIEAVRENLVALQACADNILAALPMRVVVLDADLRVRVANQAYYLARGMTLEEIQGKHITEVFPPSLLEEAGLQEAMASTLRTGERVRWSGYRQATADHGERIVNIRLDPCDGPGGEPNLLVSIEDVTDRHRELYERRILQQITRAILGQLELPRLLHAILTGMTAGGAVGLGFNRAVMMLADPQMGVLRAVSAVGPENREQAGAIWSRLADRHRTMEDLLADYDQLPPPPERPLYGLVQRLVFPLSDTSVVPMLAIADRETVHVEDAANDPRVSPALRDLLGVSEFVVAPMVAKDKPIGAAIADNFITQQPIGRADVQLLTVLADQAALSIDSARMYEEATERARELDEAYGQLQEAQQIRIQTEKLAAIGRVTAIVAHEIRNPLSTIGGFARSVLRSSDTIPRNRRSAQIIVDEVQRLETILGNLLDFAKPRQPEPTRLDLRALVAETLSLFAEEHDVGQIETRQETGEEPVLASVDDGLFRQLLVNLFRNAMEAMPDGGTLTVGAGSVDGRTQLWVRDSGCGIPEGKLDDIFDGFYTTKPGGTGIGLAISRQIVTDHGARMDVESRVGEGTTFRITFPDDGESSATEGDRG